jgi:hypothetical protein
MLQPFLDKTYIYYFNDILVYLEDKEQYNIYIKQVLKVLAKKKFRLKLSKYNFYIKEIMFLGYIIILKKINLDPKKNPSNYYLRNTSYSQTNIIFLRIYELL